MCRLPHQPSGGGFPAERSAARRRPADVSGVHRVRLTHPHPRVRPAEYVPRVGRLEDASGAVEESNLAVDPQVGRLTRVCGYDRPGALRQDGVFTTTTPVPQPTTPEQGAAELHALLTAAKVPGPSVLAAHSLGGPIVRYFAAAYQRMGRDWCCATRQRSSCKGSLTAAQLPLLYAQWPASTESLKSQIPGIETFDLATWFAQPRSMPQPPQRDSQTGPRGSRGLPGGLQESQLAAEQDLAASYSGANLITKTDSSQHPQYSAEASNRGHP